MVMREITRNGLRFPLQNDDYEIPPELGAELMQLNQEMIDAKNRRVREDNDQAWRGGAE
jgi:hypothetical protein